MDQVNNLEVKLRFTSDGTQGSRALKDLQQQAKGTSAALEDARKQLDRVNGGAIGNAGFGAAAGGGSDGKSGWLEFGKLAAGAVLAGKAIDALTRGLQVFGDKTLSLNQRIAKGLDVFLQELPLVGAIYKPVKGFWAERAFGDSLRGFNSQQRDTEYSQVSQSLEPMRQQASATARELAISRFGLLSPGAVSSGLLNRKLQAASVGEGFTAKQIEGEEAVRQALTRKIRAQQEADKAASVFARDSLEATFSGKGVFDSRLGAKAEYEKALGVYQKTKGGGFNAAQELLAGATLLEKTNNLLVAQSRYQRDLLQAKESAVALAQKEYEVNKATTEVAKVRLSLLQQQADKAKSAAEGFGALSGTEQLAVQSALLQAKRSGIDTLPEDQRNLLLRTGLTSEFATEQTRKSIQNDPVYQSIVGMLGGKTSEQLEAEVKKLKQEIEVKIEIDERQLSEAMSKAAQEWLGKVLKITNSAIGVSNDKIQLQLSQQKTLNEIQ